MIGLAVPLFTALLAAIGFIWLLHSRRERRIVVSNLVLWRQLQNGAGAQSRRQLLPPITWPLVLQILAALAFTLALSQPFWGGSRVPDHLIVVLDNAGSMQALVDNQTLFETGKRRIIQAVGGRDRLQPARLSVLSGGASPRAVAVGWPWQEGGLETALARIVPTDGTNDWPALARVIASVATPGENAELLFVSTAPAPDIVRAALGNMTLSEISLVNDTPGAAISGSMVPVEPDQGQWTLTGEVLFRHGLESVTVSVDYVAQSSETPITITSFVIENPGGTTASVPFSQDLTLPGPGLVFANIAGDATPRDNTLRFVADPAPQTLDVLYVGEGNQPLLRALNAIDGVRLYRDQSVGEDASRFDLVIADRIELAQMPATNAVVIAPQSHSMADPDPDFWDANHPLSRNLDWAALSIKTAHGLEPHANATVLLAADGMPLITAEATSTGRIVRIGFDPTASNWPETVGFPVFVAKLLDWMGRSPGAVPAPSCVVGAPCPLDARLLGERLTNLEAPLAPSAHVSETVFIPEEIGLFVVGQGDLLRLLPVNPAMAGAEPGVAMQAAGAEGFPYALALWCLGAALLFLVIEGVIWARRGGRSWRMPLLRLASIGLTLAALFNLPWPWLEAPDSIVMVVPGDAAPAASSQPASADGVLTAAVLAGPDGRVLASPQATVPMEGQAARITHADHALNLAAASVPPGKTGTLVLGGDMARNPAVEQALAASGMVVNFMTPPPLEGEIRVDRIALPQPLFADDTATLTALVHSADARSVAMDISANGKTVASQDIELVAGQNRILAVLPDMTEGENLVEMHVAGSDAYRQNDAMGQIVAAQPVRPVAVISTIHAHAQAFAGLLRSQGLQAETVNPERAPVYLNGWLRYGGIVIINSPALSLSTRQQRLIETSVAEHGIGLVLIGGPDTFGPGGYFNTPLEALSPLSSRIPQDAPEVAMVFVLDRSGSMEQRVGDTNRLDMAKTATIAAAGLLNPQSLVGLVVFDENARTLLPMTRLADNPRAVETALEGFDPGGGTSIYAGLAEALQIMNGVAASAKHIVVMTDGLSRPGDIPGVLAQLRAEGITVSSVALGRGADITTARTIARLGGGAAHASDDFEALPSILSQEAMLFTSPIQEGVTQPRWTDRNAAFLAAFPRQLPPLSGFVATTAKPEADLYITAPNEAGRSMPILAHWRYGNGMVMAVSTDATGPWSTRWQQMPEYSAFWSDILRQFQPTSPRPGLSLRTHGDGEYLEIEVSALDPDGTPLSGVTLAAMVTGPDQERAEPVALSEIRPGLYSGRQILNAVGRYAVVVDPGTGADPAQSAYYHSFDAQYDFARSGGAQALALATGGRAVTGADIAALGAQKAWSWHRQWPVWALLAFIIFMADLAFRYGRRPGGRGRRTPPDSTFNGAAFS